MRKRLYIGKKHLYTKHQQNFQTITRFIFKCLSLPERPVSSVPSNNVYIRKFLCIPTDTDKRIRRFKNCSKKKDYLQIIITDSLFLPPTERLQKTSDELGKFERPHPRIYNFPVMML